MKLTDRLSAFEISPVPTWVFDADEFRQRWANAAALEMWRAKTKEELYSRDFSDMSPSTRARIRGYIEGFQIGKSAEEEWTLYPKGEPVTMKLYFSGIPLDDGRIGCLIQAFVKEKAPPADLVRSIEALRHTSVFVTLLDEAGKIVLQNPAAIRAFGAESPFEARFLDVELAKRILHFVLEGAVFSSEERVRTTDGEQWHAVEARLIPDPATGKKVVLVQATDESARLGAERKAEEQQRLAAELRETLDIVERQRQEILALSAPVLEVADRTLALPIIGSLDERRAAEIEGRVLAAVAARGATRVILDLTGADAVTEVTAEQVARLGRAIRLLGSKAIVTGVTALLARNWVSADVDLRGMAIQRTLRDGISLARRA